MFAHCETLTPLASLLGLFKPPAEEEAQMPHLTRPDELLLQQQQPQQPAAAAGAAATVLPMPPLEEVRQDLAGVDAAQDDLPLALAAAGRLEQGAQQAVQQHRGWRGKPLAPGAAGAAGAAALAPAPPPAGWEAALATPPGRTWRGGRVSPLGANLLLVLYRRVDGDEGSAAAHSSSSGSSWGEWQEEAAEEQELELAAEQPVGQAAGQAAGQQLSELLASRRRRLHSRSHLVRLVYNEQVVALPGCGGNGEAADGQLECDLETFLREVVGTKADAAALERLCAPCEPSLREGVRPARQAGMDSPLGSNSSSVQSMSDDDTISASSSRALGGQHYSRDGSTAGSWADALVTPDGLPLLLADAWWVAQQQGGERARQAVGGAAGQAAAEAAVEGGGAAASAA